MPTTDLKYYLYASCFGFFLLISGRGTAQDNSGVSAKETWRRTVVTLSYFGVDTRHPGGRIALERPLLTSIRTKSDTKTKVRQLVGSVQVGAYYYPRYHTGVFGGIELGFRRTEGSGIVEEIAIGMGGLRTVLPGPVYGTRGDGSVKEVPLAGSWYLMPSASVGIGYDLFKRLRIPVAVFVRPTWFWYFPFNTTFYPEFALNAGIRIRL